MKGLYDVTRGEQIRLWITYGTIFALLFVGGYLFSQGVINQPWTARTHMGTAVIGDALYIVGGQSSVTGELLADIWEINPYEARLRFVGRLPYACYRPELAVSHGTLYIVGGYDGDDYRSEILKITNGRTESIGDLPTPRGYGAGVGVGNSLFYAGGCDRDGMLDEIIQFDLDSGETSVVAHFASPRRFIAAAQQGGLIYFVGGEDAELKCLDEIVEFDPVARQVVRVGHLPTGRYLVNLVAWEDRLLALGGKSTLSLNEVVSIAVSGPTITSEIVDEISELSWSLSVESTQNRLFIVGGLHPEHARAIGLIEYAPGSTERLHAIALRKNPWK